MTFCPVCDLPAYVEYTTGPHASSAGPVDVHRLRCFGGHFYDTFTPADSID